MKGGNTLKRSLKIPLIGMLILGFDLGVMAAVGLPQLFGRC